ncbi:NADAR family protein [Terrimonas sp. NA20]|uniref:NADAR family protein n=1 Tax=Terrimonas ginsenosidimutans TaxID=2908004 RepID=A0ABS9KKD6_9BACT|nr:NADAR family protein [Terrimonas ginsenosidimutans]MCG2612794.1 NADAR family protein [Terrimonas ginsenosidimutans]
MNSNRTYQLADSVVFQKTKEEFGGLSNMAAGYSLNINDVIIPTAEHLYQACRFPHSPELQLAIISEPSPMTAKKLGRQKIEMTRKDWDKIQFKVMKWVLEVKLSQNWESFGKLLRETGDKHIVELAPKNKIWGAAKDGSVLTGTNALGRLLMQLRETYVKPDHYQACVNPLEIEDFLLLGNPIGIVCNEEYESEIEWSLNRSILPTS